MDISINEIIFEPLNHKSSSTGDIMQQFLESGYFENNGLCVDRFLDADRTINLEKLELGIILAIEYLENFNKSEKPVQLFIKNMDRYFNKRNVTPHDIERITEESSFILGFCKSIAEENTVGNEIIVAFSKEADIV